jgi:hypothetical protein
MFRPVVQFSAIAALSLAAGAASAQPPTQAPPAGPLSPPAEIAPAAPAFKKGAVVVDRAGAKLGPIKSLTEAPRGPMVVIEIDGKLVSVPQATLSLKSDGVVSSQTKAQILAAAGAPP